MPAEFAQRLLPWYDRNKRDLPWRRTRDPYRVWVSEVMLQQTRADAVVPYYERWLTSFPTVAALAAAAQSDVLQHWEGLGYYARARNLHRAAQQVLADFGGQIPDTVAGLLSLPGIGRYTAGAIASIAFDLPVPVLDGNVKRVLARAFNLQTDIRSAQGERELWALAERLLPAQRPGDYNQALMELGATVCTPKQPACPTCPLLGRCEAQRLGVQADRPVVRAKPPTPHYQVTAAIIQHDGQILLAQRPLDGLLGGLWEFPGGKQEPGESLRDALRREIGEELGMDVAVGRQVKTLQHAYTHFKITLHVFECDWISGQPRALQVDDVRWVSPAELGDYAMGKVDREIAHWLRHTM